MKQILVYGEVLFDLFPEGNRVLGGAPFNVAWHLQGFGFEPVLLSAIGEDDLGQNIIEAMKAWGMSLDGLHRHESRPTGRVTVRFDNSQPSYEINPQQAYDDLPEEHLQRILSSRAFDFIYHGSLALRTESARKKLLSCLDSSKAQRLVDINLRSPWWTKEETKELIQKADVLKINDEELEMLSSEENFSDIIPVAKDFIAEHKLRSLILTRGRDGASFIDHQGGSLSTPIIDDGSTVFVDSVGAGDAFCSVCLIGLLEAWSPDLMLKRASAFATKVCGLRGATTDNPEIYQQTLKSWSNH